MILAAKVTVHCGSETVRTLRVGKWGLVLSCLKHPKGNAGIDLKNMFKIKVLWAHYAMCEVQFQAV